MTHAATQDSPDTNQSFEWKRPTRSILNSTQELLHGYRSLLVSQFEFFRIKVRDDAEDLVRKNTYLFGAVALFIFAWFGVASWGVHALSSVMSMGLAILLVSGIHLVGGLALFMAFQKQRLHVNLAIDNDSKIETILQLDTPKEKAEGLRALAKVKESEVEILQARGDLEFAIKETISPRRIIGRHPKSAVASAFAIGIALALTKNRD